MALPSAPPVRLGKGKEKQWIFRGRKGLIQDILPHGPKSSAFAPVVDLFAPSPTRCGKANVGNVLSLPQLEGSTNAHQPGSCSANHSLCFDKYVNSHDSAISVSLWRRIQNLGQPAADIHGTVEPGGCVDESGDDDKIE